MLKPVYAPFTHLGDRAAAALQAHFDSILLLRPYAEQLPRGMRELERRGFLEVLSPPGDAAGGAAAVGAYLEWARRHAGGTGPTGAFWQARLAEEPAGGDRSAFQLASQINRRRLPEQRPAAADPLPAARVFLRLAQELDEQEEEVRRDLARCQRLSAEMMAAMAGRPRQPSSGVAAAACQPPSAGAEHRLPERLRAWARLFLASSCPSPVLVTTRAAVVAHLVEASAAARLLPIGMHRGRVSIPPDAGGAPAALSIRAIEDWLAASEERIETLDSAGPGHVTVPGRGGLLGCLFPNDPPHRLLGRFAAVSPSTETTASNTQLCKHTIVVLVPADDDGGPCCPDG